MRLICPNCGAQYEIDVTLLPEEGRDVQCSNCRHAWYQRGPDIESVQEEEDSGFEPAEAAPEPVAETAPEPVAETVPEMPEEEDLDEDEGELPPAAAAALANRKMDAQVLDVLREEAAREQRQRQEESGITPPEPEEALLRQRDMEAQTRKAQATGEVIPAEASAGLRSELLPDIDEINSTLKPGVSAGAGAAMAPKSRGRGFRLGFGTALLIAAAFVSAYAYAPKIVAQFPASEPVVVAYVNKVNDLRTRLEVGMQRSIETITEIVEPEGEATQ